MYVFDNNHVKAAEELGRRIDNGLISMEPSRGWMDAGVDYGDFQTVLIPVAEVERGGIWVPAKEVVDSRVDLEQIADRFDFMMQTYGMWWHELRYDSAFKQSNRTVVAMLQKKLGIHNAILGSGRPNSYPVSFSHYKMLGIKYLRILLRNSYAAVEAGDDGDLSRVLAISPQNRLLLDQMEAYQEDEFGKPLKGDDDAVDALIAGATPLARKHRVLIQQLEEEARNLAKLQPPRAEEVPPMLMDQVA